MIKFQKIDSLLVFSYTPMNGTEWIKESFEDNNSITLKKTFSFIKDNLYGEIEDNLVHFIIAELDHYYYKFDKEILDIDAELYIHEDVNIDIKFFVANNNISVFQKIADILLQQNETEIRIGYQEKDNLPLNIFLLLLKNFPTSTELKHYANMRIDVVIKDYLETNKNYEEVYDKYMNNKLSNIGQNLDETFDEYEAIKYEVILKKLEYMLKHETIYSEKQWQTEILQIIKLIYPKYMAVFENVTIKDIYKPTNRYLDFMLIDFNGNTDIIEIKKPFGSKGVVTTSKYRDNYVPVRELSGSIMQVEKYVFYLNKWGKKGEKVLTKKYASELPHNFSIKITNPTGIIIMGRDYSMNTKQQEDFEIIKRKYKNIVDILTYDDIVRRLNSTIEMLKK